ncbi:MAG TPA: ABC transporter ATP-binding protein/permease, partial [Candidatus Acidoferrum sp.]|nr:ABC transporter ATP-binding protein/permease [Candidatus Acidoferrum sp.]
REVRMLSDGIYTSPQGRVIRWLFATIVVVIILNMVGQVWLNRWNGNFFDAIGRRDVVAISDQLVVFVGIVAFLLVLVVAQTWLQETIKLRSREWLTNHLLDVWLVNGRPYRLEASSDVGANPDQRLQEDARRLCESTTGLGIGFIQNVFLLMTFIGVLWQLSNNVAFDIDGLRIAIPGYMVWCALFYALLGSFLTWLVGRRLIGLDASRYSREAELRYQLVRVNDKAEAVALSRGEANERRNLDKALGDVLQVTREYIFALARLTWITSGYGWFAIVVPTIVAMPGYLQGKLTIGGLMMVIGAFNQVQGGLRWFVDNAAAISDWRATLFRVAVFDQALREIDDVHADLESITVEPHPAGNLSFEHLTILNAFGKVVIDDANLEIAAGERVLIVGDPGAGKSTLIRAISGLWLHGHGLIKLPPREQMMFMSQNPYLPLGTLQAAICYPYPPQQFTLHETSAACESVGLIDLTGSLNVEERWDKVLSQGQLQLLAFARMTLQKPKWVFLDEATSALDHDSQARVMRLFDHELKGATVVSIGNRSSLGQFHQRQLQLKASPDGSHLGVRERNRPSSALLDRLTSWFGQAYATFVGPVPKAPDKTAPPDTQK